MHTAHLIRVSLAAVFLILFLVTIIFAIRKKNTRQKYIRVAVVSFLAIFVTNYFMHQIINFLYPTTENLGKLVFLAHGKTSDKGYCWLGLYYDNTWEIGKSDREIEGNGKYTISRDTIFLETIGGTFLQSKENSDFFIVHQDGQIELENTGIDRLNVVMNKFQKSTTNL